MTSDLKQKLQFGCYHATLPQQDGSTLSVLCKPLNQADYAEGWQTILPKRKKKSTVYNWNVNLAQLPPHLWHHCHKHVNNEGEMVYNSVNGCIYRYNVSVTEDDDIMVALRNEMDRTVPNLTNVEYFYDAVKQHTSGWLVMRAKKLLIGA